MQTYTNRSMITLVPPPQLLRAPDLRILASAYCDSPVNACTLFHTLKISQLMEMSQQTASFNPAGNRVAAVCDSNTIFLFDVRNDAFSKAATATGSEDAAFSVSWSQSRPHFAVASQDGSTMVFDERKLNRPIAEFTTQRANSWQPIPYRVAKYSPSGCTDLLMFCEQTAAVHLVDARSYSGEQVLPALPPPHADCSAMPTGSHSSLAGACFSADGGHIYVGASLLCCCC